MSKLKIGMFEQDITPYGPVKIPGQFYQRVSGEVETPLSVNIFACESEDGEQLIIAACDLTKVTDDLFGSIKKAVAAKCAEIDAEKVIVSATHIHTAMYYDRNPAGFADLEAKYLPKGSRYVPLQENDEYIPGEELFGFLTERISDGIVKAWNARKPAAIAPAFGRAVIGHSRRVAFSDGTAKMYGIADKATFDELESGNDSGVELLYVFDADRKPMGALVNIACPAQVLEHCTFISSDYWGKARIRIKEALGDGFVTVGLCAAAGCQSPRDMIRFVLPDTKDPNLVRDNEQRPRSTDPDMYSIEGAEELGERVSEVVLKKLKTAEKAIVDDVTMKHEVLHLHLPLRKVTETDRLNAQENLRRYFERANKTEYDAYDLAAIHVSTGILDRYALQETTQFYKCESHVARLGDIAFATNPFELFLNYGNRIRARSWAKQTFLIQLACGAGGYLPTERAEKGGHYSAYVSSGKVGHEGGDLLVAATLDEIQAQLSE